MKFVSYQAEGGRRTGVLQNGRVLDVSDLIEALPLTGAAAAALAARGIAPAPGGLLRWLQAGEAQRATGAATIRERLGSGTSTISGTARFGSRRTRRAHA